MAFVLAVVSHSHPYSETSQESTESREVRWKLRCAREPTTDPACLVYSDAQLGSAALDLQLDALEKCGVAKELIFTDKASGASQDRAGLDTCFKQLRPGDILLVWRLDRLGRSVRHLVTLIDRLKELGVGFRSVCDGAIDTTTPSGELIFHIFSSLAQFERRLIQERTKAGIAATRARGRKVDGRR